VTGTQFAIALLNKMESGVTTEAFAKSLHDIWGVGHAPVSVPPVLLMPRHCTRTLTSRAWCDADFALTYTADPFFAPANSWNSMLVMFTFMFYFVQACLGCTTCCASLSALS
jgi:hypothetical protein